MELVFEDVNTEALDLDRIARGVARVARQVPFPDDLTIVFAGNFASSINARSPATPDYSAQRLGGIGLASAMTLQGEGRASTIVATAAFFVHGTEVEELDGVRLLAHEGWHVAVQQRDEETGDIRFRWDLGDTAKGFFHATAGVAMGEYRVERALCDEQWWPLDTYVGELPNILAGVRSRLRDVIRPAPDFPDKAWRFITDDLHQLLTHLAYVAAEELTPQGRRVPADILGSEDWQLMVGGFWDRLLGYLDRTPAAKIPMDRDELDRLVAELAGEVPDWLSQFGFELDDKTEGLYVFHSGMSL